MQGDEAAKVARREALQHAMGVLGVGSHAINAGQDPTKMLRAAREQIEARGIPGRPGSPEYMAGTTERAAILAKIDGALAGMNKASGLDPLTWVERFVHQRLGELIF